jgi:hypothetical protein
MTDTVLISNKTINSVDTIEELYLSPVTGAGTVIRALTVTNNTTSSKSYKAYIYDALGGLVGASVPLTDIARDRFNSAPSIVNQIIPAGGTLRAENSVANGLNFYMSGLEQSSV